MQATRQGGRATTGEDNVNIDAPAILSEAKNPRSSRIMEMRGSIGACDAVG